MNQFIDIILEKIRKEYSMSPPLWKRVHGWNAVPPNYRQWIQKECYQDSDFDTLRLRRQLIEKVKDPQTNVTYATCPYGKMIVIYEDEQSDEDLPWELWGRILRIYYKSQPFTVYFLASTSRRVFPNSTKESILPQNINGGYTYPCRTNSIVVYRAEDATRVLIHELQHACCLDKHENGIDRVEAETEAWAELLYCALLSKGSPSLWRSQWSRQWKWLTQQNQRVQQHMKMPLSMEFPWRYTIGKEQVFREWFYSIPKDTSQPKDTSGSLRLTVPPTLMQKREQMVRTTSIIL